MSSFGPAAPRRTRSAAERLERVGPPRPTAKLPPVARAGSLPPERKVGIFKANTQAIPNPPPPKISRGLHNFRPLKKVAKNDLQVSNGSWIVLAVWQDFLIEVFELGVVSLVRGTDIWYKIWTKSVKQVEKYLCLEFSTGHVEEFNEEMRSRKMSLTWWFKALIITL